MRSHIRTVVVLALAVGLLAWFLHNVDLGRVAADIIRARPEWLALSFATMFVNLAIRSWRWKYLLEPLVLLFILAGDPKRLGRTMARLERVVPSALAGLIARVAEKFALGLGAIRRPRRLLVALLWSFPLWIAIGAGIWAVAIAFRIALP